MNLATFEELLRSPDSDIRMKVTVESRHLSDSERFLLMSIAAQDKHSRVRYNAISQLASLGEVDRQKSREILEKCLKSDSEIDVRAAAADALGALKFTESYELLIASYESTTEWLLQLSILAAIGYLGDRRCFSLLVATTGHENPLLRITAIRALGDLADPQALPVLQQFLEDQDWQIRHALAQAAASLGEAGQKLLILLSQDQSVQVAETAKFLLAQS